MTSSSLSPFFKSPVTDLTASVLSQQWYGRCADLELKVLDCLEAYGLDRGLKKCDTLMADFNECALRSKQTARVYAMRNERHRQYLSGERSKENHYAPPPVTDSF